METNTEKIAHRLNALLEKNSDAERGFEKAAELASAQSIIEWFSDRAIERGKFKQELKEEIHSFGYPAVQTSSLTGDMHRAWMDLKATFSGDNDEAMLQEALRGEKASLDEYNEAIAETTVPPTTLDILKNHRSTIEQGLEVLRALEGIEFQKED